MNQTWINRTQDIIIPTCRWKKQKNKKKQNELLDVELQNWNSDLKVFELKKKKVFHSTNIYSLATNQTYNFFAFCILTHYSLMDKQCLQTTIKVPDAQLEAITVAELWFT